jgi:hypothetical protein
MRPLPSGDAMNPAPITQHVTLYAIQNARGELVTRFGRDSLSVMYALLDEFDQDVPGAAPHALVERSVTAVDRVVRNAAGRTS